MRMTKEEVQEVIDKPEKECITKRTVGIDSNGNPVYERRQARNGEWQYVYHYVPESH